MVMGLCVIGHYFHTFFQSILSSDTIFTRIFRPFLTQLHFTFLTPHLAPLCLSRLCSFFLCFMPSRSQTNDKNAIRLVHRTPNDSTTGLPTFRNNPAVVPPCPNPAREPLLPPPNAPTTQSSGLPELRARAGVRPSRECSW